MRHAGVITRGYSHTHICTRACTCMHACMNVHACTYTCMHTRTHACTHSCTHMCTDACTHVLAHPCTHVRTHRYSMHTYVRMHAYVRIHAHASMHTHMQACTRTCKHAHAHASMHTHMHTWTQARQGDDTSSRPGFALSTDPTSCRLSLCATNMRMCAFARLHDCRCVAWHRCMLCDLTILLQAVGVDRVKALRHRRHRPAVG